MHRLTSAIRWLTVISVALAAARATGESAASPAVAAQADCEWTALASGDNRSQHTLIEVPNVGVLAYGGFDYRVGGSRISDDLALLDLRSEPQGSWNDVRPAGMSPGDRAEHSAILRTTGATGTEEMVVYGGLDAVPAATPTALAVLASGAGSGFDEPQAPAEVVGVAFRLALAESTRAWSRIDAAGQKRAGHSSVFVPTADLMVMFGGRTSDESTSADNSTWALTLGEYPSWERYQGSGAPGKRYGHSAVFDTIKQRMVVFGGTSDGRRGMNDLYFLNLADGWATASWSRPSTVGTTPAARYDHVAVFLPRHNWMIVHGGTSDGSRTLSDSYALDLNQDPPRWSALSTAGRGPTGLAGHAAAYYEPRNAVIIFGGEAQGSSRSDTFALSCAMPGPTATSTRGPTSTPSITNTPRPMTATRTPSPTLTRTVTLTRTPSRTPSVTPTPTATRPNRWYALLPYLLADF